MTREQEKNMKAVLNAVAVERARQEKMRGKKFTNSCADGSLARSKKLAILAEEFGEVAKLVAEMGEPLNAGTWDDKDLHDELVQVAAVAVAWAESIDRPPPF